MIDIQHHRCSTFNQTTRAIYQRRDVHCIRAQVVLLIKRPMLKSQAGRFPCAKYFRIYGIANMNGTA